MSCNIPEEYDDLKLRLHEAVAQTNCRLPVEYILLAFREVLTQLRIGDGIDITEQSCPTA